ncbi:MAG TPA: hypothetical protein VGL38_05950 [bacterium]
MLIRRRRQEKVELRRIERERAMAAGVAPQAVLDRMDAGIAALDVGRTILLDRIAKLIPDYDAALAWACGHAAFDPAVGTTRYYKQHGGYFTFGMPGRSVIAVWVQDGEVVRANTLAR